MTVLYRVRSAAPLRHDDPLHVSNFFPEKQRWHSQAMQRRQDLILYIANMHSNAMQSGMPLGMIRVPMRLSSLRAWSQDFHVILDQFFDIVQLGYNLGEKHDISTLTPKNVEYGLVREASCTARSLVYEPPERPDSKVVSKVYIRQDQRDSILQNLRVRNRLDLIPAAEWLLDRPEVNFHFEPAGRLKKRDTSVWPVPAIETWPSWLREQLFGPGLDIDSAYTQFLVSELRRSLKNEKLLGTLYPDLLRSVNDKAAFRRELCEDVLQLPMDDESIGVVKRICMSLANGSRISPMILVGSRAFSEASELIMAHVHDVTPTNLTRIAKRFERISQQYSNARRTICSGVLKSSSTRKNMKRVFGEYFDWEREARYAIWEAIDKHGVMVHDGIDGVPQQYLEQLPKLIAQLGIKLTA